MYPSFAERKVEPFSSISLPLRWSFLPVLAIEFVSETGSVFSAALPTVGFPFVVSSVAGVSFFSTGLFFNFDDIKGHY